MCFGQPGVWKNSVSSEAVGTLAAPLWPPCYSQSRLQGSHGGEWEAVARLCSRRPRKGVIVQRHSGQNKGKTKKKQEVTDFKG